MSAIPGMTRIMPSRGSRGSSEAEALGGLLELSLFEVKAELDAAIQRRRAEVESGC